MKKTLPQNLTKNSRRLPLMKWGKIATLVTRGNVIRNENWLPLLFHESLLTASADVLIRVLLLTVESVRLLTEDEGSLKSTGNWACIGDWLCSWQGNDGILISTLFYSFTDVMDLINYEKNSKF